MTAHDHPFLRANLPAMNAYRALEQGKNTLDGLIGEYKQAEMGKELSTHTRDDDCITPTVYHPFTPTIDVVFVFFLSESGNALPDPC